MIRPLLGSVFFSLLLTSNSAASSQVKTHAEENPPPAIRVRVFNYASVSGKVLGAAKRQTSRIVAKAGVETVWIDCPTSLSELPSNSSCRGHLTGTELVIRIVQRSANPRYPLGFAALPTTKGGIASQASVFFEAAEELAVGHTVSKARMLGFMMAHEVGHLLLGRRSHSRGGIMRTPWRKQEMERVAMGTLGFTGNQRASIRNELSRRMMMAPQ